MSDYTSNNPVLNSQTRADDLNTLTPIDSELNSKVSGANNNTNSTIINNIFIINNYPNNGDFNFKSAELSMTQKENSCCEDDEESLASSSQNLMCRICHCEETSEEYLISPCYCSGTLRYVHQRCLQQWLKSNGIKSCELCKYDFIMSYETRPFKNWEKLDMNNIERRKILCSVTFHIIAITCVIWSLYVLIDRTAEEGRSKQFDWSFWTKLVVVAIGFTGGVVFMYIQCKMYIQLCNRWRQYNRVIIIQPITEEILRNSKKKIHQNNKCLSSKILVNSRKNSEKTAKLTSSEENALLLLNTVGSINNEEGINLNQSNLNRSNPNDTVVNFA